MNKINELEKWLNTNKPRTVEGKNNISYSYYYDLLLTMVKGVFDFKNFPTIWDKDFLLNKLFIFGYFGVFRVPSENSYMPNSIIALDCGIVGQNMYYRPTDMLITNPLLGSFYRKIGYDGELVYLNNLGINQYQSADLIISRYSSLLAECDASLNVSLMNSRVAHIFKANNTAELQTLKKMYDEISLGKPAIFLQKGNYDIDTNDTMLFNNVKNTYIGNDILITKRTILNEFLSDIGISNANIEKRERLNTDEVNIKSGEVKSVVSVWKEHLNECFNKVNSLFGTNITVEYAEHVDIDNSNVKEETKNVELD